MEDTSGGAAQSCGKVGAFVGAAAAVLSVAVLVTNPVTLAGGLILAHSISFAMVAGGCSLADLLS